MRFYESTLCTRITDKHCYGVILACVTLVFIEENCSKLPCGAKQCWDSYALPLMSRLHYTTHLTNNQQLLLCNTRKSSFTNLLQLRIFLQTGWKEMLLRLTRVKLGEIWCLSAWCVWHTGGERCAEMTRVKNGKITTFGDFAEILP